MDSPFDIPERGALRVAPNHAYMKNLTVCAALLALLCLQQARAAGVNDVAGRPLSVSALKELVVAPRIFTIAAYVVEIYDRCPPCPPQAVCETCTYGIYVADDNRPHRPGPPRDEGLYLATHKAGQFHVGTKYLFKIEYRLERSAAGAWRQTGPQLIDSARIDPEDNSE